ncbi:MAG: hypothetical protein CMO55_12260 [Verrucomicrobiales bacterium]|nr:hypothetical protein [Verrucomicrobiales bacterium]
MWRATVLYPEMPDLDFTPHFRESQEFIYPDWAAINDQIDNSCPTEDTKSEAWRTVTRKWVSAIRRSLGDPYRTYETENFLFVTADERRIAADRGRFLESAKKSILKELDGVAAETPQLVAFLFHDLDTYYTYISEFDSDGELPQSGGTAITTNGYAHFVMPVIDGNLHRNVFVHEMTHILTAHLDIPIWLNEALSMRMESATGTGHGFYMDEELHDRHVAHWNAETIQQFWSGHSWEIPGDSFELSYSLATVVFRILEVDVSRSWDELKTFLTQAKRDDAGEQATRAIFDLSLAEVIEAFLGEGDWAPKPGEWKGLSANTGNRTCQRSG